MTSTSLIIKNAKSTLYCKSQGTECQYTHLKINANDFAFSSKNFKLTISDTIIESIEPGFISNSSGIEYIDLIFAGLWQIEEAVFRDIFEIVANNQLEKYEEHTKLQGSHLNYNDYPGIPITQVGSIKKCNEAAGIKETKQTKLTSLYFSCSQSKQDPLKYLYQVWYTVKNLVVSRSSRYQAFDEAFICKICFKITI